MKKILAMLLVLVMVLGMFAACGNNGTETTTEGNKDTTTQGSNDETTEKQVEMKTLTFMGQTYNTFTEFQHADYWTQSMVLIKALDELEALGIKCEFETISDEQYGTAAAQRIQAGINLPDVFRAAGELSAKDLYDAGIVANIKDILDQYDEDDSVREFWRKWVGGTITILQDGEGNLYELPYLFNHSQSSTNPEFVITGDAHHTLNIRKDWVEAIGMEWKDIMTPDEVIDLIIAIRENDGNGNGAKDEVLGTPIGTFKTGFEYVYGLSRGLISNWEGETTVNCNLYNENFPKYIEALQKLYQAGCIDLSVADGDITTSIVYGNRGITQSDYACAWWTEGNIAGYETTADYQAVYVNETADLTDGWYCRRDAKMTTYAGPLVNAEADFEAVARWMDWFYTEESRILMSYGIEGIHWEMGEDGEPVPGVEGLTYELVDGERVAITWESDDARVAKALEIAQGLGMTEHQIGDIRCYNNQMSSIVNANCWPHVRCYTDSYDDTLAKAELANENALAGKSTTGGDRGQNTSIIIDGKYMQYAKSQIKNGDFATITPEENEAYNAVAGTVDTYVSELVMGLITGQKDLKDLDKYIEEVNGLGLTTMVEIRQAQLDRFNAAANG